METSSDLVYETLANRYFYTFNITYLTELENVGGLSSDISEISNSIEKLFEITYKIYDEYISSQEKNLPDAMILKMKDDYRFVSIFILASINDKYDMFNIKRFISTDYVLGTFLFDNNYINNIQIKLKESLKFTREKNFISMTFKAFIQNCFLVCDKYTSFIYGLFYAISSDVTAMEELVYDKIDRSEIFQYFNNQYPTLKNTKVNISLSTVQGPSKKDIDNSTSEMILSALVNYPIQSLNNFRFFLIYTILVKSGDLKIRIENQYMKYICESLSQFEKYKIFKTTYPKETITNLLDTFKPETKYYYYMYVYVEYLRNSNTVKADEFLKSELSRIISISSETQKVEFLINILDIIYLKLTSRGDTIIQLKRVCDYLDESFLVAHSTLKEKILKIVNEIYKPDAAKKRLIINSQELFNEQVKPTIMNNIPSILEEQIDRMELFLANIKIDKFSDAKYLISKIKVKEIMKFYEKYEPTEDQIELWNNYWKQQNPYDRNTPPEPPGWWLRDQILNIHSSSSVSSTDCKLKLLKQLEFEPYQIEDVAEDIYEITLRIAEEDAAEEKMSLSKKESYIKRNVVDISLILNCRKDENTPKYYGYGDVYDEERASLLNDDQRVEICDILAKIWLFIKQKVEDKDVQRQLIIQFMIAFRDHLSGGVCTQGWVSALTNIFGVYTKELGFSCLTKDQEQSEDLTNKLLIDSGILNYEGQSDKVTIEKIFNQRSEVLAEADIESDDWDEKSATIIRDDVLVKLTKEQNAQFKQNLERYKILYDPYFEKNEQKRIETMKEFLNEMFPDYFMLAVVDYLKTPTNVNDRYTLRIIKDAVSESFAAFQIRKLKVISESSRERREKEIVKQIPKSTFRIYKRDSKYKKKVSG